MSSKRRVREFGGFGEFGELRVWVWKDEGFID
jgi:hypothetical protein